MIIINILSDCFVFIFIFSDYFSWKGEDRVVSICFIFYFFLVYLIGEDGGHDLLYSDVLVITPLSFQIKPSKNNVCLRNNY